MRFTRPGARPRQRPSSCLDSTQLGRGVLGACVEDERAGAELRPGEVFQLVPGSVGWIELDVEVVMAASAAGRLLVHRHHVRQRPVEKAVVFLEHAFEVACERLVVFVVEVSERAPMTDGREMDLVRPACEWRDEGDPSVVIEHGPLTSALALDDIAVKAPAGLAHVPRFCIELALYDRRHEWIGVDLSVRMAQGDADDLSSVLEDIDVTNVGQPAELAGAIAPYLDEVEDVIDALLAER